MKKNQYKNITFNKKVLDNSNKINDNNNDEVKNVMNKIKEEYQFNPTLNAYVPYFNEMTKKYELFTVSIDPLNNKMELFRKELPHDNMNRAIMEMQSLYAADHIKKLREQKHQTRENNKCQY